jgi:hypothetical protein
MIIKGSLLMNTNFNLCLSYTTKLSSFIRRISN